MSRLDMKYYNTPKLAVVLKGNRLFSKNSKVKIIGEYLCSSGTILAVLEGESYLFDFDDFDIKGDWVDKKKGGDDNAECEEG